MHIHINVVETQHFSIMCIAFSFLGSCY